MNLQESRFGVLRYVHCGAHSHAPCILIRDMWDRLTAPTPTVTSESTFRQPIRRFTVSRPPRSACRFTCVSALYWLCVSSFPVGFSGPRGLRSGLASEALRVVLRGFVVLPLLTQGQLYAVYLFFTTGGGGSVSLITPYWFGVRGSG